MSVSEPAEVDGCLVDGIAGAGVGEGGGEAERHGGVVGGSAGEELEVRCWPEVDDRGKAVAGAELDGRAEGVDEGDGDEGGDGASGEVGFWWGDWGHCCCYSGRNRWMRIRVG